MNIAILIGISDYSENIQNLPGSKNDVIQFDNLIRSTNKFDEILTISQETRSSKIKDKLTSFINGKKGNTIEEVFFYFSGHGDFANDEFYYILSDFSFDRRTQTSLQNSELDNLIKSLSPKLVTKVVDACHSGVNYIKDIKAIDTYIKSTSNQFNNCYFLYSSLNAQSSFQNKNFSFFTLSFLNAVKSFKEKEIRYKDIIDYISDEFSSFPEQTPFFVTQADFTELFCTKNNSLEKFLNSIPQTFPDTTKKKEEKPKFSSLEEMVKADSENHLSNEEVKSILNNIKDLIESFSLVEEIKNLYEQKFEFPKFISTHVDFSSIGRFVAKNKNEYFAKPTLKTETYEETEKPSKWDLMTGTQTQPYNITKTRQVIDGYTLTADYPYEQIIIKLESKFPNIASYNCTIAFVTSDRKIKLYYFITDYSRKNWTERKLNNRFEWNATELSLKDNTEIKRFIISINEKINEKIINDIKRLFETQEKI